MTALTVSARADRDEQSRLRRLTAGWSGAPVGLGITAGRVAAVYLVALVVLNVLNVVALVQRPWLDDVQEESGWLLLALESNPSTWFTSVAMLVAALAVLLVAASHPSGSRARRRWTLLALVPAVLSVDEVAELHERLGSLGQLAGGSGLVHYSWIVPGVAIVAALAIVFGKFVLVEQGPFVRNLLVAAGALVVGGGIVVEAVNGWLDERGTAAWIYQLSTTVEENLELLGVGIVIVGLVVLASRRGMRLELHQRPDAAASGSM